MSFYRPKSFVLPIFRILSFARYFFINSTKEFYFTYIPVGQNISNHDFCWSLSHLNVLAEERVL